MKKVIAAILVVAVFTTVCSILLMQWHEKDTMFVTVTVTKITVTEGSVKNGAYMHKVWSIHADLIDEDGQKGEWNWKVDPSISLQTIEDFQWLKGGQQYTAEKSRSTGQIQRLYLLQKEAESQ